jgi:hypothetical protein
VREATGRFRPVVYLNRRSAIVQGAARGSQLHVLMLAAVVQHELAHLAGADEAGANLAEAALFRRLATDGTVPMTDALAYLKLLDARSAAARTRNPAHAASESAVR